MAVSMAAASMAGHVFGKGSGLEQIEIMGDGTLLGLKGANTGRIELEKRTAADAADNNRIHWMAAKTGNRVACAMLMYLVAVVDRGNF